MEPYDYIQFKDAWGENWTLFRKDVFSPIRSGPKVTYFLWTHVAAAITTDQEIYGKLLDLKVLVVKVKEPVYLEILGFVHHRDRAVLDPSPRPAGQKIPLPGSKSK